MKNEEDGKWGEGKKGKGKRVERAREREREREKGRYEKVREIQVASRGCWHSTSLSYSHRDSLSPIHPRLLQ
jgi:hypothetical protein